jgi:hypothetical protein
MQERESTILKDIARRKLTPADGEKITCDAGNQAAAIETEGLEVRLQAPWSQVWREQATNWKRRSP